MRSPHRLILLHSDRLLLAAVRDVAPDGYEVCVATGWDVVPALSRVPTAVLLVDPYHGSGGTGPSAALRELLRSLPLLPVVAAISPSRRWLDDLRLLGSWGVEEILDLSSEATPAALRRRLALAAGRPLRRLLRSGLPAELHPRARQILEAAAEVGAEGGGPLQLSRAMGMHRDSLHRWCVADGLPAPRVLFAWMRLLLAAEKLDHTTDSLTRVALSCGYSSDGALRAALQRQVGTGSRELRRQGAFAEVASRFLEELGRHASAGGREARALRSRTGG